MRIDADEELTKELVDYLDDNLSKLHRNITGIYLNRRIIFMDKWIKHGGVYPLKVLRIFRKGFGHCEDKMMDEHIVVNEGTTLTINKDFIDDNKKSLEWWINKHNWYSNREVIDYININNNLEAIETKGSLLSTQEKRKKWFKQKVFYKIPPLSRSFIYFLYRYVFRLGFLDGKEGLIFHFLQGCWYRFLVDAKIIEYKNKKTKSNNSVKND